MKIIGLGSYSRTGKDTFADAAINYLNSYSDIPIAKKISFAWKLKDICHQLYAWAGVRDAIFYDTPEGEKYRDMIIPELGMTPVDLWVKVGTPCFREHVYQNTWIDYVLKTNHGVEYVVIPDVRFPNEVNALRDLGATLIKVVRPGFAPRNTVSDRALLDYRGWDMVLGADGDIHNLRLDAQEVSSLIKQGKPIVQDESEKQWGYEVERLAIEAAERQAA
jgi:hypothetical protein